MAYVISLIILVLIGYIYYLICIMSKKLNDATSRHLKLEYVKTRRVETPAYGNDGDAGIDFFVPMDINPIVLKPREDALIPSGIKMKIPMGYSLIAFNKSGVATKKKFLKGAQVIDATYQGEIHIHVVNVGKSSRTISPGEKIMQFVLLPVKSGVLTELGGVDELFRETSERGQGGFGSTGSR